MKNNPRFVEHYEMENGKEKLVKKQKVELIPESMRFKEIDGKWIPVVKTLRLENPQFIEIKEYGPNGEFLSSTISRK